MSRHRGFNLREAALMLRPEILDKLAQPLLPLERAAAEARLQALDQLLTTVPPHTVKRYRDLIVERDRLRALLNGAGDR